MKGKTTLISLVAIALVAAVVAGCGGNNNTATARVIRSAERQPHTIAVSNNGNLGKILVDSQGRTLYLFQKDTGTMSACTGACAIDWPPLTHDRQAHGRQRR